MILKSTTTVALMAALILSMLFIQTAYGVSSELGYKWREDRHAGKTLGAITKAFKPGDTLDWYHHSGDMADISGTGERAEVVTAFQTWKDDIGSFVDFNNVGVHDNVANSVAGIIGFPDSKNTVQYNADLGCGSTCPVARVGWIPRGDVYIEADLAFNDAHYTFSADPAAETGDQIDIQSVALHEIGHWFILDDLRDQTTNSQQVCGGSGPLENFDMVMRCYIVVEVKRRSLEWGDTAGLRYIYPNTYDVTSSLGTDTQDGDLAAGLIDSGSVPDYVFAWSDKESSTSDDIKYIVGKNVNTGTAQPPSWGSVNSPTQLQNLAGDIQGVAVALASIDGDTGNSDLVVAWIDNLSGDNQIKYKIGWDLNSSGVPSSWSSTKTVDTSNIGTESSGLGIGFIDTPDSGSGTSKPEMFVFWVDNPALLNDVWYKVGWNIDVNGNPTGYPIGSNLWSSRVKADLGLLGPGAVTSGMGISLGNWLDTSNPDVIVFWVDEGVLPGDNHGTYAVGEDVTVSGSLANFDWKPKDSFPGQWLNMGGNSQGAGVAILNADSGSRPDASFVWIDNPSGANLAKMRTEWNGRMGTGSHDSPGLTVKTVRQSDNTEITDLWVNVYDSAQQLITSGYSPLYVPLPSDGTYYVDFSNFNQYYFTRTNTTSNYYVANWGGGRVTIDVINGATVHGIYYDNNNPGNYVKMTYESKDLSGNAINGMYGGFKDINGNVLSQGYTPYTIGVPKNAYLKVIWNDYGVNVYQYADLVPNSGLEELSDDNSPAWGGEQELTLTGSGPYTDTGRFTP